MPDNGKIEIPVEKLDEIIKVMDGMKAVKRDLEENMISKEAAQKQTEELIEKAMAEYRKEAAIEKERKILFGLSTLVTDPCIDAMRKAMKVPSGNKRNLEMAKALTVQSAAPDVKAFKDVCDDLVILDTIMSKDRRYGGVETLKTYQHKFVPLRDGIMKAIAPMDTVDTANWVPTGMSSQVIDLPIIYGQIEPLFEHVYCPTKAYDYPINLTGPDTVADLIAEATTGTTNPGDTYGQNLTDSKMTFTAAKLRSRVLCSFELDEDSIVPMLPKIKEQLKKILDQTVENTILNGDSTATHFDTDVEALGANDGRTAWKGIRRLTIGVTGLNTDISATWAQTLPRAGRAKLGKFGIRPSELAWIIGPKTYANKFLSLDDVKTVNVFGVDATVKTGQLDRFDGVPVIISEFQREDVGVDGFNAASGNTYATIAIVNHRYFFIGDRRLVTLGIDPWATTEQYNLLCFRRLDFEPFATPSATYPIAWSGFKLTP